MRRKRAEPSEAVLSPYECAFYLTSHEPVPYAANLTLTITCPTCGKHQARICDPCTSALAPLLGWVPCDGCGVSRRYWPTRDAVTS